MKFIFFTSVILSKKSYECITVQVFTSFEIPEADLLFGYGLISLIFLDARMSYDEIYDSYYREAVEHAEGISIFKQTFELINARLKAHLAKSESLRLIRIFNNCFSNCLNNSAISIREIEYTIGKNITSIEKDSSVLESKFCVTYILSNVIFILNSDNMITNTEKKEFYEKVRNSPAGYYYRSTDPTSVRYFKRSEIRHLKDNKMLISKRKDSQRDTSMYCLRCDVINILIYYLTISFRNDIIANWHTPSMLENTADGITSKFSASFSIIEKELMWILFFIKRSVFSILNILKNEEKEGLMQYIQRENEAQIDAILNMTFYLYYPQNTVIYEMCVYNFKLIIDCFYVELTNIIYSYSNNHMEFNIPEPPSLDKIHIYRICNNIKS